MHLKYLKYVCKYAIQKSKISKAICTFENSLPSCKCFIPVPAKCFIFIDVRCTVSSHGLTWQKLLILILPLSNTVVHVLKYTSLEKHLF